MEVCTASALAVRPAAGRSTSRSNWKPARGRLLRRPRAGARLWLDVAGGAREDWWEAGAFDSTAKTAPASPRARWKMYGRT